MELETWNFLLKEVSLVEVGYHREIWDRKRDWCSLQVKKCYRDGLWKCKRRGQCSLKQDLLCCGQWKKGIFLKNIWCGDPLLRTSFPSLFATNTLKHVWYVMLRSGLKMGIMEPLIRKEFQGMVVGWYWCSPPMIAQQTNEEIEDKAMWMARK